MSSNQYTTMNLEQFISKYDSSRDKDIPEFKEMFLSMDRKMKMYHEYNYYISSFKVQDIIIYQMLDKNGKNKYDVNFIKFEKMDDDFYELKKQNIFYVGCLAVGIYNNCLSYINPEKPYFLKSNFFQFAENMPSDVVPYYRGVIERNASVYLSDFMNAKEQQEIEKMKREAEKQDEGESKIRKVSNPVPSSKENAIWGTSESAFSTVALFPIIIAILGILIPIILNIILYFD